MSHVHAAAQARIKERVRGLTSPFRSAEAFVVDYIVDPAETRRRAAAFVNIAAPVRTARMVRFMYRP